MPHDPLHQLNQELENTQPRDSSQQADLNALKEHVNRGIDDPEYHPTLLTELEEAVIAFGDEHPQLAAALRGAINVLSTGGV